jgi:hypothetical protein
LNVVTLTVIICSVVMLIVVGYFFNVVHLKGELDIVMVITAFGVFVYSTFTIIAGLLFENKLACFRHTSFFKT